MATNRQKLLNQYEAAALVGLSPDLLGWLTSYAPKAGVARKLKKAKETDGVMFFTEDELLSFNEWLKTPWPRKNGNRPPIPKGIRNEIKVEANGECAICNGHKDTCEAAHLDPVAKSNNNHPENLLWLCANHHTAYDDGMFGPDSENAEFVQGFKVALHRHKRMMWRMQDEVSQKLFLVLENCDSLARQLEKATTAEQVKAVEKLAKKTMEVLPNLAPVSKADPKYKAYKAVSADVSALVADKSAVSTKLKTAQKIRSTYAVALGYVVCPLCNGVGAHKGTDCPVCNGDREIAKEVAARVDLHDFAEVDCPACRGQGSLKGADCPACGGEGQIEHRFADYIDANDYAEVTCPLCEGSGGHNGADCPVCRGDRMIERRYADAIDVLDYAAVKCPLCKGKRHYEGEDCPCCGGHGEMDRHAAARIDTREYKLVKCPICKGRRHLDGCDCPACGGNGEIQKRFADNIDPRDYFTDR